MMTDLRLPNITGTTEKEQLLQIKGYLHQLVSQLQWALNSTVTPGQNAVLVSSSNSSQQVVSQVGGEKDAAAKFAEIKPLIIKSAEIVEAYYEEINEMLVGMYVAESDFGTFKERTEQYKESTSTSINTVFSNLQEVELNFGDTMEGVNSEIDGIKDTIKSINYNIVDTTANIKSGLLYYDKNEIPVYGYEVGQSNVVDGVEVFKKYARFTADRLSFYGQNDAEVAYISDYKLYITNAEVTSTLKLGGYRVDTTSGLAFKWAGRS
jgi:hypothetical protein